jgi:4-hydroxybenzoate polyprenyltransferase
MNRFGAPLLRFIVFSNLFIAICAIVMVRETSLLLLHSEPDPDLTGFVFFSTICSYSFHWYLTGPSVLPSNRIKWLDKYRPVHVVLFFIGLFGSLIFFLSLKKLWPWLLISVFVTFLYSAPKINHPLFRMLRKVALGKTIFLAFVWMYVTTMLPILFTDVKWTNGMIYFILYRFFLIYAICILFDYRDRADDKAAGIRSLITYLPEKGIRLLFFASIFIAAITAMAMITNGHSLLQVILLLIPVTLTALFFNHAREHFSDILYYLVLDGLMALSAFLMLIPRI